MTALLIGYAHCSTGQQDLTAPRDALAALGVASTRVYLDHGLTGTNRDLPGLREAMAVSPSRQVDRKPCGSAAASCPEHHYLARGTIPDRAVNAPCPRRGRGANGVAVLTRVCCPDPVTYMHTERLILRSIDTDEAERIVARQSETQDSWARDFPFEGDVIGVTMFLRATAAFLDQYPFGHYMVVRAGDGQAIGGIGFKGQPDDGSVEIGYGLARSARGNGYAAEAARALVKLAREHGLSRIVANTDKDNAASQRTLEHAGFTNGYERGSFSVRAQHLTSHTCLGGSDQNVPQIGMGGRCRGRSCRREGARIRRPLAVTAKIIGSPQKEHRLTKHRRGRAGGTVARRCTLATHAPKLAQAVWRLATTERVIDHSV